MLVAGLTGRSGSGKTTVAAHLRFLGYPVADGDAIARQVVLPGSACLEELTRVFGADIIGPDGSLLRHKLAEKAFRSPEETRLLTEITHPPIQREILRLAEEAKQAGAALFFIDGAAIVSSPVEALCDALVVVCSPEKEALRRIQKRDALTKSGALQRLAAQTKEDVLRQKADFIIENDGTLEGLHLKTQEVARLLLQREMENRRSR